MKKTEEISSLAKNIKRLMKEKKLSKSFLVGKTELDYHTIAKIENGITPDPRINTVVKIAKILEVSIDDLIK
ncbi:helix-turn-helix transcriptional regulator [Candidatus Wolfebacteria bacterium]|nr:helix-turn-helix transcriptional regulator [Candidatus Wolfebacteria bacterium]